MGRDNGGSPNQKPKTENLPKPQNQLRSRSLNRNKRTHCYLEPLVVFCSTHKKHHPDFFHFYFPSTLHLLTLSLSLYLQSFFLGLYNSTSKFLLVSHWGLTLVSWEPVRSLFVLVAFSTSHFRPPFFSSVCQLEF